MVPGGKDVTTSSESTEAIFAYQSGDDTEINRGEPNYKDTKPATVRIERCFEVEMAQ